MFHFTGKCFSLSEENLFWTINICWDPGFEMRSIQTYFTDFREAINEVCLISARGYFIWSLCLHLIAIIWNWIVICLCCLLFWWQSLWCSHDPFDLLNKTGDNNPLSQERERSQSSWQTWTFSFLFLYFMW